MEATGYFLIVSCILYMTHKVGICINYGVIIAFIGTLHWDMLGLGYYLGA